MRAKAYLAGGVVDRFYGQLLHDPRMTGVAAPELPD
jgi:hypothetical protein